MRRAVFTLADIQTLTGMGRDAARRLFDDRTQPDGTPGPLRRLPGGWVRTPVAPVLDLLELDRDEAEHILEASR